MVKTDRFVSIKAHWIRERHSQGATIEELARRYGLPESEVVRHLAFRRRPRPSRALAPGEKQRRIEEQARLREEARVLERAQRWDRDDWRYRDDERDPEASEVLMPPAVFELVAQAGASEIPATVLEPPALEPWSGPVSPHASPGKPRKITAEVLSEALRLHEAGMSWPAIARKFGCHRMAFYHAVRRPQN
ncbi:MAG TPA: helix-turn-helix domain-containing protein [Isosphaeraceae bacterium]|nr:helix-turn-helix domain-containing protein [Isosphaeraceae bacterium]